MDGAHIAVDLRGWTSLKTRRSDESVSCSAIYRTWPMSGLERFVRNPPALTPSACDTPAMSLRASIFGPASTTTQAVVGAVVAFTLALLIGFGLKQGADSAVFTALLVGLAVLMIGLKRRDTARR
jgi:hypothetical protein